MAMGGRGRRQVLQLDDVSSSHPPRHQVFQRPHSNEQKPAASNPLLSLVGQYNSDSSDEEENDVTADRDNQEGKGAEEESVNDTDTVAETAAQNGMSVTNGQEMDGVEVEIPLPGKSELPPKGQEPEPLQEIPLPEPSSAALPLAGELGGSSIDSEVASFLAEIESISKDQVASPAPDDRKDTDLDISADSSQPAESDFGFIPRPDASVPMATEETKESKASVAGEEKKTKPSSSSAYKSMFVKGAVEFTKKEKEVEKRINGAEAEEELPEEPVSEWQMVQDESTQYYYYWNLATNEVTWEIPPGYTQFLLRYREYEERLAKIPKEKLQQLKEKKKQGADSKQESSGAAHSSETKPQSKSKHRKDKHRKEASETASSLRQIGPQLPPQEPATSADNDVKTNTDKTQGDEERMVEDDKSAATTATSSSVKVNDSKPLAEASVLPESAADSTSVDSTDVEAIFSAALAAVAGESVADSSSSKTTANTSSVPDMPAPGSSIDVSRSTVSAESTRPSSSVDSPVATDTDSSRVLPTATTATISAAVVSSSSVVLTAAAPPETEVKDSSVGNDEAVVTNSGVKDDVTNGDDDDDDFDMDFDDIDDLDRALEKALEKKLEKKKAELEKLEKKDPEDVSVSDSVSLPSSSRSEPSQSESQKKMGKVSTTKSSSPIDLDSAVSSSVKIPPELKTGVQSSRQPAVSSAIAGDGEVAGTSGVKSAQPKSKSSKSKRSAAESSNGNEKREPGSKKARLVAYDTQTDEESMDTSDEVTTTPVKVAKQPSDDVDNDNFVDILPTPPPERADNLSEILEMANTAMAKLAFLDVTSNGLSLLQISLIQLQTRFSDWENGGLIGEYFYQRLHEVNNVLKQYESSAVPDSWTCQWDSTFRRYFYTNTQTGEVQWDYPKDISSNNSNGEVVDSTAMTDRRTSSKKKGKGSKAKRKVKAVEPEPGPSSAVSIVEATSAVLAEAGAGLAASGRVAMTTVTAAADEDLDGVAMAEEEVAGSEGLPTRLLGDSPTDSQPSAAASTTTTMTATTTTVPTTTSDPKSGSDGFQAALQALFPGEPLPPGTELLLGLPPPPPPPLPPPKDGPSTTDEAYTNADDSSNDSDAKDDQDDQDKLEDRAQKLDPEIDGEEMIEDEEDEAEDEEKERKEDDEEEAPPPAAVQEDSAVISRPPQLRFPAAVSSQSSSASFLAAGAEPSSSTVSASHVRSAGPLLNPAALAAQPDSASSTSAHSPRPASPKLDEAQRSAGSPAPANEATSSSAADSHRHEKHKKKKKEKLGTHTMSLKKKGVSSLVQKWQKVKKEVEQEERANEKRQQAIRQQLEEWKKENS